MKKLQYLLLVLVAFSFLMAGCSKNVSFAEMKKAEKAAITAYLTENNIKVITLQEFLAKDSTTDVSKNEYVLFNDNGVYMQIVRKGDGNRVEDGSTRSVLCRYVEYNLKSKDTTSTNIFSSSIVDKMLVSNNSGTYSGTFTSGYMLSTYSSSVPLGWLVPMPYIRLSRNTSDVAKVRLIVPYSAGNSSAYSGVVPYWYEITYQAGI